MSTQQRGLGRGLSALIPKTGAGGGVETVDIDLITPNPHQPRASFEPGAMQGLAESIREHGVLQPIVVTQADSGMGPATYQLIAGERRLQAARMAGVARMPVVIREAAGAELLEIALVENLLREDLNPLEEAQAFRQLHDEFSMTQEHIAKRVGRSRGAVANTLRLLGLPAEILESIRTGQISEGHARALLSIEDARLRLDVWRKVVSDELTVRQAEEIAKSLRAGTPGRKAPRVRRVDPHVRAIEDDLRHALGTPVAVKKGARGGSIVIRFHSDEELEAIIEKISR
ncbi:MAG TPA: ParB/RepB/Spo0J family partition protein [Dehalococcoidia bacterium]|nr:ParB/RepB/Spo0J family partition protein [Dehalococcoidia bacterium]